MSDVVIRATDLKKTYRLYSKPSYRFRDIFGMLGKTTNAFTEHAALDGVNLEIRRGEKVAIIGRNGAGKSTLLKLVTGVIEATSGTIEVNAKVHALLQIGTGFHPDFTGRENVYAYLAQLGITGSEADRRCAEAVEFAEIEEYINQPVKTYSTGMAVRLMFSVSTAIAPDLLVLDEVLGVGDAYFSQKSFNRMRDLCEGHGATLLLVTHDIYSAAKLCSRVVWIDRGAVLMDGAPSDVLRAYEDSIRQQEERRLRAKTFERLKNPAAAVVEESRPLLVEVRSRPGVPQDAPVYFSAVELRRGDETVARLPLDDVQPDASASHLVFDASCWGEGVSWQGRRSRPFQNFGSPFHKVGGVFAVPAHLDAASLTLHVDFWCDATPDLTLHAFVDGRERELGALPPIAGGWTSADAPLDRPVATAEPAAVRMQGTRRIVVDHVEVLGPEGEPTHFIEHGKPATVTIGYKIPDASLREHAQVIVTFHRDGVQTACRIIARHLLFDAAQSATGTVTMTMPKVTLGSGMYFVTVMVTAEGYFDRDQTVFYSINPEVYCCLNRVLELNVTGGGLIATGTAFVGEGEWALLPEELR